MPRYYRYHGTFTTMTTSQNSSQGLTLDQFDAYSIGLDQLIKLSKKRLRPSNGITVPLTHVPHSGLHKHPADGSLYRQPATSSPISRLESLPLEVLENIAMFLPISGDKVNLAWTSGALRHQLGVHNRYLWFRTLRSANEEFQKYDCTLDYYKIVLNRRNEEAIGCESCLASKNISVGVITIAGIRYKLVCRQCRDLEFWEWSSTIWNYPEINFPSSLMATWDFNGTGCGVYIRIQDAARIIERHAVPSDESASQPEFRFLAKWNRSINQTQYLGSAIVLGVSHLVKLYQSERFSYLHVLKSPEAFRGCIERLFLELSDNPAGPFHYSAELYQVLLHYARRIAYWYLYDHVDTFAKGESIMLINQLLDDHMSPYWLRFSEFSLSENDDNCDEELIHDSGLPCSLLRIWIKEHAIRRIYGEDSYFSSQNLPTKCCFCAAEPLERPLEGNWGERCPPMEPLKKRTRRQNILHILQNHNSQFKSTWKWIG
ncbi:hypothetical protein Dda_2412 [Drechslerella dactyloides]|uniref:F-box domain-containing protein n=1 Tax=Drechslerella dactyloides TaxID=74499 RepID=A0AAD6J3W5_DREDA|nr:hypothetical protein Dda_2412 [Drechslerella dactyloides]